MAVLCLSRSSALLLLYLHLLCKSGGFTVTLYGSQLIQRSTTCVARLVPYRPYLKQLLPQNRHPRADQGLEQQLKVVRQ
jgi:hypothetical protein